MKTYGLTHEQLATISVAQREWAGKNLRHIKGPAIGLGAIRRMNYNIPAQGRREVMMTAVRTGGCLCGAVRYESAGEPMFSLLCHCRDCQHQSGSAYVAAMRVPAAGFRVTQGEPKLYVSASDAGNRVTRAFCPECGCPLFIRVSARPDIVGLRVGSLDDPSEFRPEADIFVKSAQPWDHMNPDLPKHQTYPPGRAYSPTG